MKKSTRILAGALAFMLALPVSAQKILFHSQNPLQAMPKMLPAEKAARVKQFKADYPLLTQGMELKAPQPGISEVRPVVPYRNIAKAAGFAPSNVSTFWAYVPYYQGWPQSNAGDGSVQNLSGVYSFMPSGSAIDLDSILVNTSMRSYGGAAVVDGIYYKMYVDASWSAFGIIDAKLFSYDIKTWQPTETSGEDMIDHLDMIATTTCQATDGTVYGQFYTMGLDSMQYGIVDYKAKTRSVIGNISKRMVAMGMGNDGTWYGIATDGNLYTINKNNGKETLVGATGLELTNSEGGYYLQTACVDPLTNTFFWCPVTAEQEGGVYTVNLKTGKATKVGDFAGGAAQIYDMIVEGRTSADGAPARTEDLTATFPNGSNSGTITFTAPTRNYANTADLSGNLSYVLTFNKDTLATGTCAPGASVSVPLTATDGWHRFIVTLANAEGVSPKAAVSTWVGYDIPKAPATVTAIWAEDNSSATVKWDAVTEGKHDAYIGPIIYQLVRKEGEKTIVLADHTTATTFTDIVSTPEASLVNVKYQVRAINGSKTSDWASSDEHMVGNGYEVPYYENFDDENATKFFTIIDANNDEKTWYWRSDADPYMYISFNPTEPKDDWLITPPIKLKGGRQYTLAFKSHGTSTFPEKMEVKYGTQNTVEGMTNIILAETTITDDDATLSNIKFTPSASGFYYLGFHACSDANMYWTKCDSIALEEGVQPTSPAAPQVKAVAGAKGALTATITVTAPTKTVGGSALTADHLTKIIVRRGNDLVHTFDNPAPGDVLTFNDELYSDGVYKWTVIPYNGEDYGESADASAYVGLDKPQDPKNPKAIDNSSSVHLSWDAISETGVSGGYVNPADVKTLLYDVNNGYMDTYPFDSVKNVNAYDVAFNTNEGDPALKQWALVNENSKGMTSAVPVALPVGKPVALPYFESAPGGELSHRWWLERNGGSSYSNIWSYVDVDAADGDGGSLIYMGTADNVDASLNTYKIDLTNAVNPVLVFSFNVKYSSETTKGSLKIEVQKVGSGAKTVFDSSVLTADMPWGQRQVDLKEFAGQVIMVKLHAYCDKAPVTIGVDKIRVQETHAHDLSAKLTVPESVKKGQKITAVVKVTNEGVSDENAYTVKVFADGTEVSSTNVAETLSPFYDRTFTVSIPTAALPTDKTEKVVKAQVILDGDMAADNDIATDTVATDNSLLPTPSNLQAANAQPKVLLTWDEPASNSAPYTEGFENFTPFAVDANGAASSNLGYGWTTIDGQAGQDPEVFLGSILQGESYPGQDMPGSFLIFNGDAITDGAYDANAFMHGHGDSHQFAAMPYESNGSNFVDGDNYLVSPALTGEAQTVSFYTRNAVVAGPTDYPERFSFLYSTTGNAKEDFTNVVIPDTIISGGEWQYFQAPLPEEAKYFAIHHTSPAFQNVNNIGGFLFSVDDVTYLKGVGKPVGYNVYCDGVLVGTVDANGTLQFYGDAPEGDHEWSVTALYPDGEESQPVSVTIDLNGIASILASGESFDVYSLDGILVRSNAKDVKGLKKGVYIINNVKVIIK